MVVPPEKMVAGREYTTVEGTRRVGIPQPQIKAGKWTPV
jgi:hypothetical protein